MSAQVRYLTGGLSLIHIPLHLYPHFLQPIVRLLFLSDEPEDRPGRKNQEPWASSHRFLNISVTPVECSVVCSKRHANELFLPLVNALGDVGNQVSITAEDYNVLEIEGAMLDAGKRVVDVTSPLALAGISIFFITTYFSDYMLVPAKSQGDVAKALEERGFKYEESGGAFVNPTHYHSRGSSSAASPVEWSPQTPPPHHFDELQLRTFALLKRRNIVPSVDLSIRIVQCCGSKEVDCEGRGAYATQIQLGLIKCFINKPRFLCLTLTNEYSASLHLEKSLVRYFDQANRALLGSTREDMLIPITLDLREIPLESTGIVCGVAGRLIGDPVFTTPPGSPTFAEERPLMNTAAPKSILDMSYLSTARAGTVMVTEDSLGWAIQALREGNARV
ncbi:MAG: hypothetical protein M1816_000595 [Peltula sp. TS41687]|nr:MAG: hypothetical protein M1816_000595 [Peltula sp. TS41687]